MIKHDNKGDKIMLYTKARYQALGVLVKAGFRNDDSSLASVEKGERIIDAYLKIKRLAKKHHRLQEMDCNGEGVIRGKWFYCGTIDDYARRKYGHNVQSAYEVDSDGQNIFSRESDKVEAKIEALAKVMGVNVEFQGDPRGLTVKLFRNGQQIPLVY